MNILKNLSGLLKSTLNLNGHIDVEAAENNIRNNILFRGPNAWILAVAIIIASVGLNVNSIPVVIGAMLISPLMGPIFGIGLGLGVNDIELMKSSGKNLLVMVSISLVVSFVYFLITPLSLSNPTELLARTSPTFYDVLIALFGGFAGILEQCRKEKGTVFSGVAIATALMPPLCTAGFGLASGSFSYFIGAIYLFIINCTFIMLATYAGVKYFRFRQREYQDAAMGIKTKRITSLLILIFIIPSIWSAVILIKENNFDVKATSFAEHRSTYGKSILYDYRISHSDKSRIELFFTGEKLSDTDTSELYDVARTYEIEREQIVIKDYTKSDESQDMKFFQDIYQKKDEALSEKENEILRLKAELENIESVEIKHLQVSKEIFSICPDISDISISYGKSVNRDSLAVNDVVVVSFLSEETIEADKLSQIQDWLKIRLETESIILHQTPDHSSADLDHESD